MNFIRYKTSSPAGDLISYMAGIKQMWKETGQKAVIYQLLNVVGIGILGGADQPYKNERGDSVLMGTDMFNKLKPLIEAQEYVESFMEYKGEQVEIDFDMLRSTIFINQPHGSLNRYAFYGFPQMGCDLSQAWIYATGDEYFLDSKLLVNFTNRYRHTFINYFFLKKYEAKIAFVGLPQEYDIFCQTWNLDVEYWEADNFLELASYIASCKAFLGNASMCFQIAEALKVPRILEICPLIPNVIPVGEHAYDAYHQSAIEYYVDKLINK